MSANPTILLSMGTRPEVIKMAPVYLELKARGLKPLLLHTGQHDGIATELYDLFGITPDFVLDLDRKTAAASEAEKCDLAVLGSVLLSKISAVLLKASPDIVMVHGDTSSALLTALAAFYQKRRIVHVEAGLRSHDEYLPFPEEKNRVLIAQLAHWHFAPTTRAAQNLRSEGVAEGAIHMVGNTIVQAAQLGAEKFDAVRQKPELVEKLNAALPGKRMLLVTMHRRENQEQAIAATARSMLSLLARHEDFILVWPVHPNPKVIHAVNAELEKAPKEIAERIFLTQPVNYPVLLWILKHAWMVLTDSGGIQEEAVALNTPVLVLRESTERPEVIEVGAGLLVGTDPQVIAKKVQEISADESLYAKMKAAKNPFGDIHVARTICNVILTNKQKSVSHG